ncbi:class I SAM-dependent methyltransferase [Paenibacillus xylaniclasticus]|uniref:class I SAM-dependent methyltransferase n=1 Tax=Paenibacillus xylaniclasticus TaxID=588083 RepID=UPI0027D8640C|nr:class I SAM-dependent methyltransferase [Paenibacillus xylaniclasticus]
MLDIGCGGGIYSKAIAGLGAASVTGVDYSDISLESARSYCSDLDNVEFTKGDALNTTLPGGQFDVVLERALIHHLQQKELLPCFQEAFRLLADGGMLLVQDRTPEDRTLEGSANHIRGYFFEKFPFLTQIETERRHTSRSVNEALTAAGFSHIETFQLWETRRVYSNFEQLADDLMKRTGRSILHDLDDAQLQELVDSIRTKLAANAGLIFEQDRWTVWKASISR